VRALRVGWGGFFLGGGLLTVYVQASPKGQLVPCSSSSSSGSSSSGSRNTDKAGADEGDNRISPALRSAVQPAVLQEWRLWVQTLLRDCCMVLHIPNHLNSCPSHLMYC
jgi:hypothetical protein